MTLAVNLLALRDLRAAMAEIEAKAASLQAARKKERAAIAVHSLEETVKSCGIELRLRK